MITAGSRAGCNRAPRATCKPQILSRGSLSTSNRVAPRLSASTAQTHSYFPNSNTISNSAPFCLFHSSALQSAALPQMDNLRDKVDFLLSCQSKPEAELKPLEDSISKLWAEVHPEIEKYFNVYPYNFAEKKYASYLSRLVIWNALVPDPRLGKYPIREDVRKVLAFLQKSVTKETQAEKAKLLATLCLPVKAVLMHMRKKGKENQWEKVLKVTEKILSLALREVAVTIVTAQQLTKEDLERVVGDVQKTYLSPEDRLLVTTKVDPSILAGVIVEVGSSRIDRSLKRELQTIEERIKRQSKNLSDELVDLKHAAGLDLNVYHLLGV